MSCLALLVTIYAGTLDTVDNEHTEMAGAVIVMAIVGAAVVPAIQGYVADMFHSLQLSFTVSMLCFVYVGVYFWRESKVRGNWLKSQRPEEINHDNTYYIMAEAFSEQPRILLENDDFTVTAFRYASGVEGLKIQNSRGHLVILPRMGQMIWDAQFDGHDLTMRNMFRQPKPAAEVVATYGCFAFHSGLWRMAARRRKIHIRCTARCPALPWTMHGWR